MLLEKLKSVSWIPPSFSVRRIDVLKYGDESWVIACQLARVAAEKLSAGGQESQCGWLKDKFGLSWQITPTILPELLKQKDAAKAKRVMEAMLQMKKIDIKTLQQAAERE